MDSAKRKGIKFDLDIEALKEHYPKGVGISTISHMYLKEKHSGYRQKNKDIYLTVVLNMKSKPSFYNVIFLVFKSNLNNSMVELL